MARFECASHPSLLIVGAGQFQDGELEASDKRADIVRAIAQSGAFTITEGGSSQGGQSDDQQQGVEDKEQSENELFDPAEHKTDDVLEYLQSIDDEDLESRDAELNRVLDAEKAGKNRKGILEAFEGAPEQE